MLVLKFQLMLHMFYHAWKKWYSKTGDFYIFYYSPVHVKYHYMFLHRNSAMITILSVTYQ